MRLTDLELYRWKFHHDIYIHTTNKFRPGNYPLLTWSQYWREHGAFVSVLPRQVGKTEMIVTLINHVMEKNEDYLIVAANKQICIGFQQRGFDRKRTVEGRSIQANSPQLMGLSHASINLFVDEFEWIDKKNHLCHILNHPWKTVTMVSSL